MKSKQLFLLASLAAAFAALFSAACSSDSSDGKLPTVASLFVEGCPVAGRATAKEIANPLLKMQGPDAVGTVGDFLLMNEKAAFIVQNAAHANAYYLYGGILVDAVALDGCEQASLERFQELGLLVGSLNSTDFTQSILRFFRAETVSVINDGSNGGPAVVRAVGTDDFFWLVEDELARSAFEDGKVKHREEPFNLEITVDYILEPASSVIKLEITYKSRGDKELALLSAAEIIFGTTTVSSYWAKSTLSISSFSMDMGAPWVAASSGEGAWAFSMAEGANFATANIGGVNAFVDVKQAVTEPMTFLAAGDTAVVTYFLSVGGTDSNSAVRNLRAVNPEPIPNQPYENVEITGTLTENGSGLPVAGAKIEVQAANEKNGYMIIDSFVTDARGKFSGALANFGEANDKMKMQFSVNAAGRKRPEATVIDFKNIRPFDLKIDPPGKLHYSAKDEMGTEIPVKILLWQNGSIKRRIYTRAKPGDALVVPGTYDLSATRGYEYEPYYTTIKIEAGKTTDVSMLLPLVVNAEGFFSFDAHCHAAPSPDNVIQIDERIATVAGEGLDMVVSTDHEFIGSWQSGIDESGLGAFVATVTGQEVTASLPEHMNMYPVVPDYNASARGGIPLWYGKDIEQIFAMIKARGAKVTQLNHPGYLRLIDYNTLTGEPNMKDPTRLGYDASAKLWSWNFDAMELMNGPEPIFTDPSNPGRLGYFDAWMSFLNLGHKITMMGNSDAHDYGTPGTPRNYYSTAAATIKDFSEEEFTAAVLGGKIVISAGAFANVSADGKYGVGDLVPVSGGKVTLKVHIEALPRIDVTKFMVFVNCDEYKTVETTAPNNVVKYDGTIETPIDKDAHIVVVGFGENNLPIGLSSFDGKRVPRFVANAIYADADGNGKYDAPGGKTCVYSLPY